MYKCRRTKAGLADYFNAAKAKCTNAYNAVSTKVAPIAQKAGNLGAKSVEYGLKGAGFAGYMAWNCAKLVLAIDLLNKFGLGFKLGYGEITFSPQEMFIGWSALGLAFDSLGNLINPK